MRLILFIAVLALTRFTEAEKSSAADIQHADTVQIWIEQVTHIGFRRTDHIAFDRKNSMINLNGIPLDADKINANFKYITEIARPIESPQSACAAGSFSRTIQLNKQEQITTNGCLESKQYKNIFTNFRKLEGYN